MINGGMFALSSGYWLWFFTLPETLRGLTDAKTTHTIYLANAFTRRSLPIIKLRNSRDPSPNDEIKLSWLSY